MIGLLVGKHQADLSPDAGRVVVSGNNVAHGKGTLVFYDLVSNNEKFFLPSALGCGSSYLLNFVFFFLKKLKVFYVGEFVDGYRCGRGAGAIYSPQLPHSFVGTYRGMWRYNARHGYGRLALADDRVFEVCDLDF